MPCYHPLHAVLAKDVTADHKNRVHILKDYEYKSFNKNKLAPNAELIELPCNQCIGCRLEYSRQWAIRIMLESLKYDKNYFLTLTYDDEHLPVRDFARVDVSSGEVVDVSPAVTLKKSDVTKFLKDLRRYYSYHFDHEGIRFFASGEYGTLNHRPHYHPILFNCPIPDLQVAERSHTGSFLYKSDIISNIWKKGRVRIAELNFSTAAYVARYVTKKHKGKDASFYSEHGIDPEFSLMSRNPGIARSYYDENKDRIYLYDKLILSGSDGKPIVTKPVKYYDRLYDLENPVRLSNLKDIRKNYAILSHDYEMSHTDLSEDVYLCVKEGNKLKQVVSLKREL